MAPLVSGRVLGPDGAPVVGARVAFAVAPVALPDTALLTGTDGGFTLGVTAPGDYRLTAHGGSGSAERNLRIGSDDLTDVELRLGMTSSEGEAT